MLFSVLTRKGKVSRLYFRLPRSRPWLRKRGVCPGRLPGVFNQHPICISPLVPRLSWWDRAHLAPLGSGPQTLPSCHHWACQVPRTQLALRLLRPPKVAGWGVYHGPMQTAPAFRLQRKWWERDSSSQGWPQWGLHDLQDTAPSLCPPAHPAYLPAQGGKAWRGLGRRPPLTPYHTLLWEDHNTANHWPRATSTHQVKGFLLMVAW